MENSVAFRSLGVLPDGGSECKFGSGRGDRSTGCEFQIHCSPIASAVYIFSFLLGGGVPCQ
jgi:hypothetical protein